MSKILSTEIKSFLSNMAQTSEVAFLEESAEKNELVKVAHKRGIIPEYSKDLAVFKTVFTFLDEPNQDGAMVTSAKFLPLLPQIVGKPINRNHNRREIRGVFIDYKHDPEYVTSKGEKKNAVIAYGLFFKSNFPEEYEEAKNLQKAGKLNQSWEIWAPKNKRKYHSKDVYELDGMEIAGGGLLFNYGRTHLKETPAYKDSDVLELSSLHVTADFLQCASKYVANDDIVDSLEVSAVVEEPKKEEPTVEIPVAEIAKPVEAIETKEVEVTIPQAKKEDAVPEVKVEVPVQAKPKCSGCGYEFTDTPLDYSKCPNCQSIIMKEGNVIAPKQEIDFKMNCLSCGSQNWLIEKDENHNGTLHCLNCHKKFEVNFNEQKKKLFDFPISDLMSLIPNSSFTCPQCSKSLGVKNIANLSGDNEVTVVCNSCQLRFPSKIKTDKDFRSINNIKELVLQNANKEVNPVEEPKVQADLAKSSLDFVKKARKMLREKVTAFKNAQSVIAQYETELATIKEHNANRTSKLEKECEFYKAQGVQVACRRNELGAFATDLSDEDILNPDKYDNAKLKLELASKVTAEPVTASKEVPKEDIVEKIMNAKRRGMSIIVE